MNRFRPRPTTALISDVARFSGAFGSNHSAAARDGIRENRPTSGCAFVIQPQHGVDRRHGFGSS